MKKFLTLTLVGGLLTVASCGYDDTAYDENLGNVKTSAYNATTDRYTDEDGNKFSYVPSTYSANRVKYYNGLYNSYGSNSGSYGTNSNNSSNYTNSGYTGLERADFNNGLITFEHNIDTANTDRLATNALNSAGTAGSSVKRDIAIDNTEENEDMNKVSYEIGNTYEEVKEATKDIIDDVTENSKDMLRDVRNDTTNMKNNIQK